MSIFSDKAFVASLPFITKALGAACGQGSLPCQQSWKPLVLERMSRDGAVESQGSHETHPSIGQFTGPSKSRAL